MQTSEDPYDRLILQHLKQYGLFTGQSSLSLQTNVSACKTLEGIRDSVNVDVIHLPATSTDMEEEEEEEPELHQGKFSFNVEKYLRTRQLLIDFEGGRPIPRLREPLDLFSIPSIACPFQGVRWPVECEVICDKIHHMEWEPPEPEPFYQQTGYERTPVPVGEEKGNIVYCIDSATKTSYYTRSRVGGSRGHLKSATFCARSQDMPTLSFESRFESGNLQKAVQVGLYDYELTLRNDMYTTKHTQWFYFCVSNMKAGVTYRFTIINLMKSSSLYDAGMRPLLYSEFAAWMKGEGWRRAGANIRYYRNHSEIEGKALYSLTWTLQFPYENDTCYLAHCYPYTYSDLQRYLHGVMSDPSRAAHCKVRVLCRSLAGNSVYVLTVTAPCANWQERRNKRAVVVTARVHPGETNGSWIMQGFLEFLLGESPDANLLRETFIFKVVPMLNPDGVVVGNYRCSLAGRDLNRNYRSLLRDSFPCVWYTRNMVKRLLAERKVVLYCDFHGHSRKNNVFMYGCNDQKDASLHLQERIFPLMMSKNATDKFSFRSCKFRIQKSKEGTGRIVMWRLGIRNSYTMESTFGGSTLGERKGTHFSIGDLKSMGYHFCDTLLDFCDPDQTKAAHCLTELGALLRQEIRKKLGREVEDLEGLSDVNIESSTSGSNSTESDGLPVHLLNCTDQNIKVKKKHLRSRKERNRLRQQQAQNASSKIVHRSIKHTDPLLSNQDLLKVRIQEKTVTPVKGMKDKTQNEELVVRVHQARRSWIPHPTTRIGVIGHENLWEDKPDKNAYFEAMSAAYLCNGDFTDSFQQSVSEENRGTMCHYSSCHYQRQVQHQPLTVSAVRHRLSSVPVQPLLFNPDFRGQPRIRGRYSVTNISLHRAVVTDHVQYRVVPESIPARGLAPCHSVHFNPVHSLNQQKLGQKRTTNISFKYYMPEKQDTMGTLRINHKRNARVLAVPRAGLAKPDTEQLTEAEKQDDILFFPDLRSINTNSKSHYRPTGDLAGLGSLQLGKLPCRSAGQQMSGGDVRGRCSFISEDAASSQ